MGKQKTVFEAFFLFFSLGAPDICSVEGNSVGIFDSQVSPGIFVVKAKWMPIIFGKMKLSFWVR